MADEQKRIMVGYNAYFTSEKVISVAKEHVKAFDAILVVVSSVVGHSLDETGKLANEEAAERLERLKTSLEKEGIPYEVWGHHITAGDLANEHPAAPGGILLQEFLSKRFKVVLMNLEGLSDLRENQRLHREKQQGLEHCLHFYTLFHNDLKNIR